MKMTRGLHKLEQLKLILEENDPRRIMEKGYAVIEDSKGETVRSASELTDGEYTVIFKDGKVRVKIENV